MVNTCQWSIYSQPYTRAIADILGFAGIQRRLILEDNFLCFGTRTAPVIFNMISDSIARMMHNKGVKCWNYLDDFLTCSSDSRQAYNDLDSLIKLLRSLGFYISWPKLQGPSTKVCYLGFEIDTINMTCKLPESKLQKLERE